MKKIKEYTDITSVFLNVTDACNLACRYCFVTQQPTYMTLQVAMDSVDFLIRNAKGKKESPSINFFGGEPLLCWDSIIVPLTDHIRSTCGDNFDLSLTTNGVLLTEEKLAYMKANQIGILLSIDGGKETQDYNRPCRSGESSFDILSPILPKVLENYPDVTFRSTVTPKTCDRLFEDMMFAMSEGFQNYFVMPNEFEAWSEEASGTLKREFYKFVDYYIESFRSGTIPLQFSTFEKCFKQVPQINRAILANEFRVSDRCNACGKCGLGTSKYAAIDVEGNLYSCQEFSSNKSVRDAFYIGSIYEGVSNQMRNEIADTFDTTPSVGSNCGSCKLNRICDGGCVANNYLIHKDVNRVTDVYCQWSQLLLDAAIYVMQMLGAEQNELFRDHLSGKAIL